MKRILFILLFFSCKAYCNNVQIQPIWDADKATYFQILLPSDNSLKSAFFKQNGYTYFIFDANQKLTIDEKELKEMNLVQLSHPSALILRGVFDKTLHPNIKPNGQALILEMRSDAGYKKSLLETNWEKDGLFLELKNTKIIEFNDPNTKEKLIVFLTPFAPLFIKDKYDMPEITFLPTSQGIAIYPKTHNFNIGPRKDGFIIQTQNLNAFEIKQSKNQLQTELNHYAKLSNEEFKNELQHLKQFIPFISELGKNRLHLEIAKLNLSQGFAERCLEALDTLPNTSEKNALLFLSYIRQDKPLKALEHWNKIENPDETLRLWKNTIDDEKLYPPEHYQKIILPEKLAFPFWYHLALKALKRNDADLLNVAIEKIEPLSKNTYQNQAYLYLKAEQTNKEQALKIYEKIAFEPLSAISGQIRFNQTILSLQTDKIDKNQAITELEKLRPLTAYTPTEIAVLQKLSQLYYETKNPAQALRTDRKLLSITKDIEILKRMRKEFERFFVSHQNPNPFQHIALYREFKELVPAGIKAFQIKQHLMYDFLSLDLLEDAYEIAMQIVASTTGIIQQETTLQAYLIGQMLNDNEKINESRSYLSENIIKNINTNHWHPILKKALEIY